MTAEYISTYTETKYIIHEMSTADLCVYIQNKKKENGKTISDTSEPG